MKYNLFLDDVRNPLECINYVYALGIRPDTYTENEWTVIRNYEDFIAYITENGLPEKVSFDHDLALIEYDPQHYRETFTYLEKTGYDCAVWLVEYCINNDKVLPECFVHSANPIGRENIKCYLNNYERQSGKLSSSDTGTTKGV